MSSFILNEVSRFGKSCSRQTFQWALALICIGFGSLNSGAHAQPSTSAVDDFVVGGKAQIGSFSLYDGAPFQEIYQSYNNLTINKNSVESWRFFIDPLFEPKWRKDGPDTWILDTQIYRKGAGWRVRCSIGLASLAAQQKALEIIYQRFPETIGKLTTDSITPLTLTEIRVESGDPEIPNPMMQTYKLARGVSTIHLEWTLQSETDARRFAADLPGTSFRVNYTFGAKQGVERNVGLSWIEMRNSRLYAELFGAASSVRPFSGAAYVHRNDLRRLMQSISTEVSLYDISAAIGESKVQPVSDEWAADMTEKAWEYFQAGTRDSAVFSEQEWQATYHGDDLKPDVVKSYVEDVYNEVGGSSEKFREISGSHSGTFKIFDMMEISDSNSGKYTKKDVQTWLDKNHVVYNIDGDVIIPKSVNVVRLNEGDFSKTSVFQSTKAVIATGMQSREVDIVIPLENPSRPYVKFAEWQSYESPWNMPDPNYDFSDGIRFSVPIPIRGNETNQATLGLEVALELPVTIVIWDFDEGHLVGSGEQVSGAAQLRANATFGQTFSPRCPSRHLENGNLVFVGVPTSGKEFSWAISRPNHPGRDYAFKKEAVKFKYRWILEE